MKRITKFFKFKKLNLKSPLLVGVISSAVVVALGLGITHTSLTPAQKMVRKENRERQTSTSLLLGCVNKAMENPQLGMAVLLSGGKVCFQILGKTLTDEVEGKGYCHQDNAKCLFKLGYVKTALATSESELSDEEVQDLETSAETAFEKNQEEMGK